MQQLPNPVNNRTDSVATSGSKVGLKRPGIVVAATVVAAFSLFASLSESPANAQSAGPLGPAVPTRPATPATQPAAPATVRRTTPRAPRTVRRTVRRTAARRTVARTTRSPRNVTPKVSAAGFGQGAKGSTVQAVQERLIELKYDITSADGNFGAQTFHAVLAFQKVNGLSRTGRVTNTMIAKLDTVSDPEPKLPDGGADRIEVDLEKQYLAVYRSGNLDRLLSISSGNNKPFCEIDPDTNKEECDVAVTPGGSFRVQSRITGYRESKLGLLYNPLYFSGGFAIHGSPSVPAFPASHGCVRIPMAASEWFVNEIPDRMPIYIFDGKTPVKPVEGASTPLTPPPNASTTTKAPTATTLPPSGSSSTTTSASTSTTIATTTTTGIARVLTTQPTATSVSVPATASTSTAPASSSTIAIGGAATTTTAPNSGTTIATVVVVTNPTSPTTPASTTAPLATSTTSATIPIS